MNNRHTLTLTKPKLLLDKYDFLYERLESSIAKEALWQFNDAYQQEKEDPSDAFIDWNANVSIGFSPDEDLFNVQFTMKDGSLEKEMWFCANKTPALQNDCFQVDLMILTTFLGMNEQG